MSLHAYTRTHMCEHTHKQTQVHMLDGLTLHRKAWAHSVGCSLAPAADLGTHGVGCGPSSICYVGVTALAPLLPPHQAALRLAWEPKWV